MRVGVQTFKGRELVEETGPKTQHSHMVRPPSTNSSIRVPDPNGQQHIWDSIRFPERDKTEETGRNMNRSEEL